MPLYDFIRSPRQASTIYGLDGNTVPRQKGLFYVRFVRTDNDQSSADWSKNLGFIVKAIDRPSVQPEVTEVNQYNKKRQIVTGYKTQPMRITFYDTVDSVAMRMWADYTQWYFGDFNQSTNSFTYDVTADFKDTGDGFGYVPRADVSSNGVDGSAIDISSQFFFNAIEVYQVWGNSFTQFTLINPKITQFDPDDLDYERSDVSTIAATVAYEAILYRNNNNPIPISSDANISAVFGSDGPFNGLTFDPPGAQQRNQSISTAVANDPLQNERINIQEQVALSGRDFRAVPNLQSNFQSVPSTGSLSLFGNYNFGALNPAINLTGNLARDVSYLSTGSPSLTAMLNLPNGNPSIGGQTTIGVPSLPVNSVLAMSSAIPTYGNQYAESYVEGNLSGGIMASAQLGSGAVSAEVTADAGGVRLSVQSYGIINAQRPSYSQLGFNSEGD